MRMSPFQLCVFGLTILQLPTAAFAEPARIIIMRHGEKSDKYELCDVGKARAEALKSQFLGQGATQSLFASGEKPDAFLAITLHTIETITPAAQSWNLPVTAYTIVPGEDADKKEKKAALKQRTQEAAHDVLTDPRYAGKIVVMTWEHKHIADADLEEKNPGEKVTLRQLLHLDAIGGVSETWPGTNYDFFWIADYAPGNPVPTKFRTVQQSFTGDFADVPANDWDTKEPHHKKTGCE